MELVTLVAIDPALVEIAHVARFQGNAARDLTHLLNVRQFKAEPPSGAALSAGRRYPTISNLSGILMEK